MPRRARCGRALALVFVAALALSIGVPGAASADGGRPQVNPDELAAARIRPAVVYLVAEADGRVRLPSGQLLSGLEFDPNWPFSAAWDCTGFVVNPDGWVATAGHCVDPESAKEFILKKAASQYIAQFPNLPESRDETTALKWLRDNARLEGVTADQGPKISITVLYGTGTKVAAKVPASVVDFRPINNGDVALLKVEKQNMPSSELATDADVSIGTSILAVGFPASTKRVTDPSLDPTNKSGTVNRKLTMGNNPEYEIDAAISEGMSGGPIIELNGKVIGISSFAPAGEPQAFNFVAPVGNLSAVLTGKGVRPMLGPADVYYRKGLDHYFSGRYSDAIKDFDAALALSPDYPGVSDLKTNAVNLRQQYGDVSVFRNSKLLWYTVSGALLLLAVAGRVTYVMLRGRRQRLAEAQARSPQGSGESAPLEDVAAVPVDGQAVAVEPHFCANCGAAHHHAERFCPNCGKHIVVEESAERTG
jgi:serine protease Do